MASAAAGGDASSRGCWAAMRMRGRDPVRWSSDLWVGHGYSQLPYSPALTPTSKNANTPLLRTMVTPSRPTFAALGCLPVAGNTAEHACLVRTAPAVTTPHAITPDAKVPRYLAGVKFALGPSHRTFIVPPAAAHPLQAAATAACGLASQEKRGIDTTLRGHKTLRSGGLTS